MRVVTAAVVVAAALAAAPALGAPADVAEVVVYADRALVTRRARATCGAGGAPLRLVFPRIPSSADPESLHAEASAGRILGVRWERDEPASGDGARTRLEAERAKLESERAALARRMERAEAAAERTGGYRGVAEAWAARGLWRSNGEPASWAAAVQAVIDEEVQNHRLQAAARGRLTVVDEELAATAARLAELAADRERPPWRAEVHLACAAGASDSLVTLRYLATGASWRPVYEVRARADAGKVELLTHAAVRQSTGEPWHDVRLSLSTARPGDSATPPELPPLVVWADEASPRKRVVAATEAIEPPPPSGAAAASASRPDAGRGGMLVTLPVAGAARVPSDGADTRVLVDRTTQPARLRLRAVPKLAPAVFQVAELANVSAFPLLAGRMEVFRDGTFVGVSPLATDVPRGARFTVSFGVEERVRASRTILREIDRPAGLLGRRRRHGFAYRHHLTSHLPTAVEVEVTDHLAVSELGDIKVELDPATTAGYLLDARDGLVTWKLSLRPGEQRALDLAFHIDVPADYQ